MKRKIERPATCEVQPVIWFLKAENFRPAEIYTRIIEACGEGALNEGNVRKWCRLFKESRNNVRSRGTKRALEQLKWVIFEYPTHNSDLAPSEYHFFVLRKILLAGRNLRSDQETKEVLQNWRIGLTANLALKEYEAGPTIGQLP